LFSANDVTQVLPSVTGKGVGDVLADRFQLVKLVGNGANGSVFLSRDLHLQCDIALKILHSTVLSSSHTIDAVRQEILLARGITHPNVIRVHDFYLAADCAFYTMDYIDGVTLADYHLPDADEAPTIAEYIGLQLIAAVEAIHQQGIVHCDIKPQNILLDKQNRLYLSDLGLAAALTSVSHQCCTPAYSAPEVIQNANHSQSSDYYAVAVTLYQLLTSSLPFSQTQLQQQLDAKLRGKVLLGHIDKRYARWGLFFRKNLAPFPSQRSQSSEALRLLWLADTPVRAARRIHKPAVAVVLSVLLALALTLWLTANKQQVDMHSAGTDQSMPVAFAIMPSVAVTENAQQRAIVALVQRVLYEQLKSQNIRLIPVERVQTTLEHLGLSQPLNDRQLQDIASLLGAQMLLSSEVTLLGDKVELATALTDMRLPLFPLIWSQRVTVRQDEVSGSIVKQLNAMLADVTTKTPTGIVEADAMPQPAQLLYNQLLLAQARNDHEQIMPLLEQFQQRFASLPSGYMLAAEWHEQQQNWLQAEHFYALALQKAKPGSYDYLLANARLAMLQEQTALADGHYQQLLLAKPFDTVLTMEYVTFLSQQNRYLDAIAQLQQLAIADKTNPDIYLQLGKLAIRTGDVSRAIDDYLLQAQVLYKRLKDNAGLADTLNAVGVAIQRQGKFAEAVPQYQQSLALFEQIGDVAGMAKASSNLGFVQFVAGDEQQARLTLQQAMQYYRQINDRYGQAGTIDNLGMLAEELGEYQQAQHYFAEAFSLRTQLDDSWKLTESLINLGYIYFVLSEFEQSLVYLKQAEQSAVANNDALSLLKVRQSLAQLKIQQGEWGQAFRLFNATSEDAKALDLTEDKLIAQAFLAKLSGMQGNFLLAEAQLLTFAQRATSEQDLRAATEFTLWLTELYQNSAQYDNAELQLAALADGVLKPTNNEQKQTYNLLLVYQLLGTGQAMKATAHLDKLQQMLREHPLPRLELKAFIAAQQINFMQGQPPDVLPEKYAVLMRHHALERLLWLELQALYAAQVGDKELVGQILNQALPLLRRTTSYWRNFVFEYLQRVFNSSESVGQQRKISDTAEFERLLKGIPEPYQQAVINRENAMTKPGYAN
jgi:eukaryotic-like serine/threonine-protein kinase